MQVHANPEKPTAISEENSVAVYLAGSVPTFGPLLVAPRMVIPGITDSGRRFSTVRGAFGVFHCSGRGEGMEIGRWSGAERHPFAQDRVEKAQ